MVSIIIINYNTFAVTCNCIRSILDHVKGTAYEIILVDNASPNDNPDEFVRLFPSVKLVKNTVNSGFANGNNLGIAASAGDVILLLNSDTYLIEDSISKTVLFLESKSDAGFVGCRLTYEDGRYQKNGRKFRSIRNELLDLIRPALYLLPYRKRAQLMLNQYFRGDFITECDWVSGAFMMFRKTLLDFMPDKKLDERFFMYGEDHLWCYQSKMSGYRSYFTNITSAIHIANASTEPSKQLQLERTMLSRELEIMAIRKNKSLYYYTFAAIFILKEKAKYLIKLITR